MAKITRYSGNLLAFGANSTGTNRTVFGDVAQSDALDDNVNSDYLLGWEIVGSSEVPSKQDFNALGFTQGQLLAYLYQTGVPEWDSAQEYHQYSWANRNGVFYVSSTNSNTGNDPETDGGVNWTPLNAATLGGYLPNTARSTDTVVVRDAGGDIYVDDVYALGIVDSNAINLNTQSVTNYVNAPNTIIQDENDRGVYPSVETDIPTGSGFESIGPTGSGATNIWSALDDMPAGATFVEVGLEYGCGAGASTDVFASINARKTGSASGGLPARVGYTRTRNDDETTYTASYGYNTAKIPIDSSGRFDIALTGDNVSLDLILIGWGY